MRKCRSCGFVGWHNPNCKKGKIKVVNNSYVNEILNIKRKGEQE